MKFIKDAKLKKVQASIQGAASCTREMKSSVVTARLEHDMAIWNRLRRRYFSPWAGKVYHGHFPEQFRWFSDAQGGHFKRC